MTTEELLTYAKNEGFEDAVVVDTKDIPFEPEFRKYCVENLCGQYGVNYACPPDCGTTDEMAKRIQKHSHALLIRYECELPNPADKSAVKTFKGTVNKGVLNLKSKLRDAGCDGFAIGAGGCSLCTPCARAENRPCKLPDMQYSCMSAYCINVQKLADSVGMTYFCTPGKAAFFGMYVCD